MTAHNYLQEAKEARTMSDLFRSDDGLELFSDTELIGYLHYSCYAQVGWKGRQADKDKLHFGLSKVLGENTALNRRCKTQAADLLLLKGEIKKLRARLDDKLNLGAPWPRHTKKTLRNGLRLYSGRVYRWASK